MALRQYIHLVVSIVLMCAEGWSKGQSPTTAQRTRVQLLIYALGKPAPQLKFRVSMLACRSAVVKGAAVFAGRSTGQGSRLQASARMVTKAAGRYLVCFDFDHTVVDENSDTWIYRALPSQTIPAGAGQPLAHAMQPSCAATTAHGSTWCLGKPQANA